MRDSIREAITQRIDQTFLSAAAAVPTVSPAGILNGVTAGSSSGNDAAAIRADLMTLLSRLHHREERARPVPGDHAERWRRRSGLMRNALGTGRVSRA